VMRDKLRKSDICCRYGGDEFVLVLPDSSLADTLQRVEQICAMMKETQIRPDMITVSAGIAAASEKGSTTAELLQAADTAMYAAKQAGRNRVVAYQAKQS